MLGVNGMKEESVAGDELKLRWNGIGSQTQNICGTGRKSYSRCVISVRRNMRVPILQTSPVTP